MKILRKYTNRKLYDSESHKYIKLKDIFQLVQKGESFEVRGPLEENLTDEIVAQAIVQTCLPDKNFRQFLIDHVRKI